ncbi:hypothetical protein HYW42_02100 [Candidatus Daviesbacteria bacterium]|nr:hypothetical protein [Candidatus Daviesbacteria bacterium]
MSKPKIDKNINVPDHVLKDLLTSSEIRMLKNRWQIINLLSEGLTIREIAQQVKVGTDTVVRTAKMIQNRDINSKISEDKKAKLPTSWIFGKSDE